MKFLGLFLNLFVSVTCFATDFFLECPKPKPLPKKETVTLESESYSIFVGKDLYFAIKIKGLLSECGDINRGVEGKDKTESVSNPYTQKIKGYKPSPKANFEILQFLVPVNYPEIGDYLKARAEKFKPQITESYHTGTN